MKTTLEKIPLGKSTFAMLPNGKAKFTVYGKFAVSEDKRTLIGRAVTFNELSTDRGGYQVRILPNGATYDDPVFALYGHDQNNILGNTQNASLKFEEKDDGIYVEISLPNTTLANDVFTLVKDEYVGGMSFGCWPLETRDSRTESGETVVDYVKYKIDEFSIVGAPSIKSSYVEVKTTAEETVADETVANTATPVANTDESLATVAAPEAFDVSGLDTQFQRWQELKHYSLGK